MARDGSGNYTLPAGNPVSTGGTISSTWANNTMTDIGSALTQSVSKDGQTAYTGNQPMGGNRHTNVGNATARNEYAALGQVQDGAGTYLTSVSGTNTITAAVTGLAAYAAGQVFRFIAAGANTGAVTLNVNALGAKAITKQGTTALVSGDIVSGSTVVVVYDGTQFQLINQVATVASQTAATLTATSAVVTDTISERTAAAGVTIDGVLLKDSDIEVDECRSDTVSEKTSGAGVTVDGVLLKDAVVQGGKLVAMTAATTTSGTSHPFSSIPSWVKRITVCFDGVSLSGTAQLLVQIGDSGGLETSGYVSSSNTVVSNTGFSGTSSTSGFVMVMGNGAYIASGALVLTNLDGNTWVAHGCHTLTTNSTCFAAGSKSLNDTLDRLTVTTTNGTDTFDAGKINVIYE